MWLEDEGCHDTVTSAWRDGERDSPMGKVVEKVGRCQEKLKWWSTRCFSNITWEIAKEKKNKNKSGGWGKQKWQLWLVTMWICR